jgi:polar amino acid transport system permease protein
VTFNLDYALSILPGLLNAAIVTFEATMGGMALAIVGGLLLAIAKMSRFRVLSFGASAFVDFVRCTPLLLQLFFLFYVLPLYGPLLDPLLTGIIALGIHYSTYTAEVYRAGIEGVRRGQWEAALALNYSELRTWTRIILPQAVPAVIPVLGNYVIAMFKDTPLLATITVRELLGKALDDASTTYRYLEPITLVGLIFLVLSLASAQVIRALERKNANF